MAQLYSTTTATASSTSITTITTAATTTTITTTTIVYLPCRELVPRFSSGRVNVWSRTSTGSPNRTQPAKGRQINFLKNKC